MPDIIKIVRNIPQHNNRMQLLIELYRNFHFVYAGLQGGGVMVTIATAKRIRAYTPRETNPCTPPSFRIPQGIGRAEVSSYSRA